MRHRQTDTDALLWLLVAFILSIACIISDLI